MDVNDEDDFMFACLFAALIKSLRCKELKEAKKSGKRRKRRPRSLWVRPWLSEARRQQQGHFDAFLTRELRNEDINTFQNYLRMPPELFDEILERISQVISRQDTKYRSSLTPGLKLALTLRHLVEGKYFQVVPPLERHLQLGG